MGKLLLSAMILLNSSAMCMQSEYNNAPSSKEHGLCSLEKPPEQIIQKIASYVPIKSLVGSILANEKPYEDCTDEEQYSIAIQVHINLWNESGFNEAKYDDRQNDLISADTVNKKLKELLKDPSIINFAKQWEKGFETRGCFIYKKRYADKTQSLRFFPLQLVDLHENITRLDISDQQFTTVPGSIGQFTQLTHLCLYNNELMDFPAFIANLCQLEHLDLSQNNLEHLTGICELTNLKFLYVGGNRLTCIPKDICRLTKLRILFLSGNQITQISESIGQLTELVQLFLNNNKLMDLPWSISKLQKLQHLSIVENPVRAIPACIFRLKTLEFLYLSYNNITDIDQLIGLNLDSDSRIIYPPKEGMAYNQLSVPACILRLKTLKFLDGNHNNITNVDRLNLDYRRIVYPPKEG